jgi:GNAT superfamily N-acetyltransferase
MTLDDSLRLGVTMLCRDGRPITYRFLSPTDDLDLITELLHRGYARLAEAGLRFVASHQDVNVTRRRVAKGETIVALDRRLVGIVTLARSEATSGSPFYDRPDVASFGQYAVEPTHQRNGIGTRLLEYVEQLALLRGVKYLALDTSEQAGHLIRFYETRGYRFVEHVRWPDVNYRSVVMAKPIAHNTIGHLTRAGADATGVAESRR